MRISDWSSDVCSSDLHVEMNEERLDLGVHTDENQAVPDIALNWLEARAMRDRLGPKNDLVANFDIRTVDTETPSVEVTAKTAVAPNAPEIAMGDAISAMRADIVIGRDIMVTRAVSPDAARFSSELAFEIVTDFGND